MQGNGMGEEAQNLVVRVFARHHISLHIDDGCMGGGRTLYGNQTIQYLTHYFFTVVESPQNFSKARLGIFHHAYISSFNNTNITDLGYTLASYIPASRGYESDGDDIIILGARIRDYLDRRRNLTTEDVLLAHVFMHELGHNLGLVPEGFKPVPFEGIDSYYYVSYRSCMNYNTLLIELIDYSDGSRRTTSGGHDFDDWGHIRLRRVATKWDVVE